ncbi:YeiH family protein [Bradyrhizobium sp. WD16]|uniref:YeiH family protein n=1 Tax=Bradyrhizobium sp. WD16 TaxID=1521768 RepID=UPI0020A2632B|nr:putative sulfate exporter family transporter [Bradyrhizobium sp. WD16]UTD26736.1 putative sulfate exporter family transporter [Bradyrhizobium sp. WD16]
MAGAEEQKGGRAGVLARSFLNVLPGTLLCIGITAAAIAVQAVEEHAFAHPYVEALVLAILIGIIVRSAWQPGPRWAAGISFSGKFLLELAVMMLGASISLGAIVASGPALLTGIIAAVLLAILASYSISRAFGLPQRISILIACGNSICGNSAIAAVAPVIGASSDDIASSIAFTAVLGVVVVLALPLAFPLFHLTETQYGTLAGLTVYAVPQVLAATLPIGIVATQVGTLVKLVRVLMLGPVVVSLSLLRGRLAADSGAATGVKKPGLSHLVPWFIVGFLLLATLHSLGLVPDAAIRPITYASALLTIVSMAALGLAVDVRVIGRLGPRITFAVTCSLIVLFVISMILIRVLRIG